MGCVSQGVNVCGGSCNCKNSTVPMWGVSVGAVVCVVVAVTVIIVMY